MPWVNKACDDAIAAKHAAEGSDAYAAKATECQETLRGAYQNHITKVKQDMEVLPRGSKKWWSLAKQLMRKKTFVSVFPPIKKLTRRMVS